MMADIKAVVFDLGGVLIVNARPSMMGIARKSFVRR